MFAKGSHLWLRPADSSKEKAVRQIVVTNETIEEEGYTFAAKLQCAEAFRLDGGMGWDNWGAAEELGGFRVGGTLVISKLQRQWQVLEAWQRLTGNKCEGSICPIVGSLHQLLLASRCVESRVRLHWQYRNFRSHGDVELSVQSVKPDAAPIGPAAERMCHTLMSLVVCRLDDENGSVNRAAALLPKECMMKILDVEMFKCFSGPKSERAILRLAVDWCSKPWRNQDDVLAVMRKVRLAGVPARTLMHLDEGSGRYAGNVTNHTLKDQLRDLARSGIRDEEGDIEDLLIEALEAQKAGRHHEEEGLVRPCFEAPNFPEVRELYRLGYMSSLNDFFERNLLRQAEEAKERLEAKLEKKEKKLKTATEQLEEAKRELAILKGEQPAQDEQQEAAGEKRPLEAAPAAESAKRPKPTARVRDLRSVRLSA